MWSEFILIWSEFILFWNDFIPDRNYGIGMNSFQSGTHSFRSGLYSFLFNFSHSVSAGCVHLTWGWALVQLWAGPVAALHQLPAPRQRLLRAARVPGPGTRGAELVELSTTILSTIGILLTWAMKIANIGEVSPYTVLTEGPVMWRYWQVDMRLKHNIQILGLKMLFGK